jgi:hypothetical protein
LVRHVGLQLEDGLFEPGALLGCAALLLYLRLFLARSLNRFASLGQLQSLATS